MTARDLIPAAAKRLQADLRHRLLWRRSPMARITRAFVAHHGLTVQAGPFAGMAYPRFAVERGELVAAQLLGSYEREIAPAIQRAVEDRRFDQYIDIGASDGYYAVGFARSCPSSTVYAYEMNPFPARVCRRLAAANGAEGRLRLLGECTVEELRGLPPARSFVLCDTEGAEAYLMDPDAVPLLRSASLVVELHAFAVPDVEQLITRRFSTTHDIEIVRTEQRHIGEYPALMEVPGVTYVDRELAVAEFRPYPMAWAVMEPRGEP